MPALQNTRAGILLRSGLRGPTTLLFTDQSVADRVSHVLLSFYSLFYSYGIGLGLGTWGDYSNLLNGRKKQVLIYLDPPYFKNKTSRLYGKNGQLH